MLKLQDHAAVHISVTFGINSHFSIALHVVVVDADVDPANDITLLHVAVTDEVVVIVALDWNTPAPVDATLDTPTTLFDATSRTRSTPDVFVADAAIVDPVLCTLLDVAVALDVVVIVDAPTTENTNVAPPDNVDDDVALAFLSRPADAVVPDAVITIDPLNLARIAEEAVADTATTAPAPSVTNPSSPKLYEPYVLRPNPPRYSAIY